MGSFYGDLEGDFFGDRVVTLDFFESLVGVGFVCWEVLHLLFIFDIWYVDGIKSWNLLSCSSGLELNVG